MLLVKFQEVMEAFHYSDTKGADFFNGHVECIHALFAALTPNQIDQFKQWYEANNNIEQICANDPTVNLVRYSDINTAYPALSEQLASFFKGLYSQQLLDLKAMRDKIGKIDDHCRAFMAVNKKRKMSVLWHYRCAGCLPYKTGSLRPLSSQRNLSI